MSIYLFGLGAEGLAVVSLLGNSFRAVTPEAQHKARVTVRGLILGLLPIMSLVAVLTPTGRRFQDTPLWVYAFCVLSLFLLPLSFAYAVIKHRVLEIPVLLKRGARYLLVRRGFVVLILLATLGTAFACIQALMHLFKPDSPLGLGLGLGAGVVIGGVLTWSATEVAS